MKPKKSNPFIRLAALYKRMGEAYAGVASPIAFGCGGCASNCCVSYFQHHTSIEWAYLWQGMRGLPKDRRETYLRRAEDYVRRADALVAEGMVPGIMCPLNDDGLCGLYSHRLMICPPCTAPAILCCVPRASPPPIRAAFATKSRPRPQGTPACSTARRSTGNWPRWRWRLWARPWAACPRWT